MVSLVFEQCEHMHSLSFGSGTYRCHVENHSDLPDCFYHTCRKLIISVTSASVTCSHNHSKVIGKSKDKARVTFIDCVFENLDSFGLKMDSHTLNNSKKLHYALRVDFIFTYLETRNRSLLL